MPTTSSSSRHQPLSVIESYLSQSIAGVFSVDGNPPATLHIEPTRPRLTIRFPASGIEPDLTSYRNLHTETLLDGTDLMQQLSVMLDDNTDEAYSWLCTVLDRVQLAGESFAEAVEQAVDSLTDIVALRSGLSLEQRVGLFGELVVLLALIEEVGPAAALTSWRGPTGEEHDFGLQHQDLEVKATLSETRQHWISGISQLMPTGNRPLYLLSVQLTAAAIGGGRTLPELVGQTRTACKEHLASLNTLLESSGYRDHDAPLYRSAWTLRTAPEFFEVHDDFPAITPLRLMSAVESPERITDLKYRIDLAGRIPSDPLLTINEALVTEVPG